MTRARLFKLGLLALAVLGIGAVAWAYWTTQGTGSAAASVGTLNAPTDVSVPVERVGQRPCHLDRLDTRRRCDPRERVLRDPDQEQRLVGL